MRSRCGNDLPVAQETTMRLLTPTAAAGLLVALTWPLPAADPQAAAKLVAPYLDDQTVAVVRLDVANLDVDAAVERFAKVAGVNAQHLGDARRSVREGLAAFRKAGATE